ncbi:Piwi-domain-containing protein [Whalleya microplaca]|nr:Piwi-domain-containing protein [Whalleya microplaca]
MSGSGSRHGSGMGSGHGSRVPSQYGRGPGSQVNSPGKGLGKPGAFHRGTGVDPARDPDRKELTPAQLVGRRVDLPAEAYGMDNEDSRFEPRPDYNSEGKKIQVQLNIFPVTGWRDQDIYQYDIFVTPNPHNSPALVKKIWRHETTRLSLSKTGGRWLSDDNKLAWSSKPLQHNEVRITVDLDGAGYDPRTRKAHIEPPTGGRGVHYLIISQTKKIRLAYLKHYLDGKISWDSHVLECMNFFDHCLRQQPSITHYPIRRNYYDPRGQKVPLAKFPWAMKGVYSAMRMSESILRGGTGLAINVDTCTTAFWPFPDQPMEKSALWVCMTHNPDWENWSLNNLSRWVQPEEVTDKDGRIRYVQSPAFRLLADKMAKVKFTVTHRGKKNPHDVQRTYIIKRLVFDEKYGEEGATADNVTFEKKSDKGPSVTMSVRQHYLDYWGIRLNWPLLPMLETTKGYYFPMELCYVEDLHRYKHKLGPAQTSAMIKEAVGRPAKRKADIMDGVKDVLNWPGDPNLKEFGISVSQNMVISNARLLQNPEVGFRNQKINPGVSGRWDLIGKKFYSPNEKPLRSWAFVNVGGGCSDADVESFAYQFVKSYRAHGAIIERNQPIFITFNYNEGNHGDLCQKAWETTEKRCGEKPQIIFFVIPNKNQLNYNRIKKNMDCRWATPSQCLHSLHVKQKKPQYISNVAMKVNSKLGGFTSMIAGPDPQKSPFFIAPTVIIGLDVSHPGAGSSSPSMAALTLSMDKWACRYAASCETPGHRIEVLDGTVIRGLLGHLLQKWYKKHRVAPKHVYFLRDGVSEGQFQAVLDNEIKETKRVFRELFQHVPQFTVIIATKRHHIRFFPKPGDKASGDRNNNPLPGTLVERDATHPKHFDFYLCSHVAIQGTARPVHYQVILNEIGIPVNPLQKMIYQHCYQYCRSTTPVSLHPAVYYSHLASNRARSHEMIHSSQKEKEGGKPGFPLAKRDHEVYSDPDYHEKPYDKNNPPPLLPMQNENPGCEEHNQFMETTMWYV